MVKQLTRIRKVFCALYRNLIKLPTVQLSLKLDSLMRVAREVLQDTHE